MTAADHENKSQSQNENSPCGSSVKKKGRTPALADDMEDKSGLRLTQRQNNLDESQAPHPLGSEIRRNEHDVMRNGRMYARGEHRTPSGLHTYPQGILG